MKVGVAYQTEDGDGADIHTELLNVDEDAEYFADVENPTWELLAIALQAGLEDRDVEVDPNYGLHSMDN